MSTTYGVNYHGNCVKCIYLQRSVPVMPALIGISPFIAIHGRIGGYFFTKRSLTFVLKYVKLITMKIMTGKGAVFV